uniref:Uncharacterized protein n=1 Tax=Rhizophora mucronata TaxID=61149 RepID=A0A2P2QRD7_RHIMU
MLEPCPVKAICRGKEKQDAQTVMLHAKAAVMIVYNDTSVTANAKVWLQRDPCVTSRKKSTLSLLYKQRRSA